MAADEVHDLLVNFRAAEQVHHLTLLPQDVTDQFLVFLLGSQEELLRAGVFRGVRDGG
jgi:hypothetical protein